MRAAYNLFFDPASLRMPFAVWRLFRVLGTIRIMPVSSDRHFSCEPFALFQKAKPGLASSLTTSA